MTTLVNDTTFQLSDTGLILNDDQTPNAPYVDIETVSGFDNAPIRQTKRDHEGVDGGFMDAEFETGRDISLTGIVFANNNPMETYLDSLKANWAPSASLVPLYCNTIETGIRVLFVKPLGVKYDWDSLRRLGMAAITFSAYAEDPRIYSQTLNTLVISLGAIISTGFAFPFAFPFGFGGVSTTSDGIIVTNGGNRPTPPVFTINGPVTNPVIMNDTVSAEMDFNIDLALGETLVIDTQHRTVRLNGTANRRAFMTKPGWFMLQQGDNFIRFRGTAGSGTLSVAYRSAWR